MTSNLTIPVSAALSNSSLTSFAEGQVTLNALDEMVAIGSGYTQGHYEAIAVETETREHSAAAFSVDGSGVVETPENTIGGGLFSFILDDSGALNLIANDNPASPRTIQFKVIKLI